MEGRSRSGCLEDFRMEDMMDQSVVWPGNSADSKVSD
jgi:hypothetical protein